MDYVNNGGFTLGGVTAAQLGIQMISSSRRPILPNTIDRTLAIPGRNGLWDFGADIGARQFSLQCALINWNAVALQTAIGKIASHLLDQYGKPRTMALILDLQPNRTYTVRYSGSLPIDRIIGLGQFTLPLLAADPAGYEPSNDYDPDDLLYDVGLDYDVGLIQQNPTGFNWKYTEQHSSLRNYSPFATGIKLTIVGNVAGGSIEHEQSGQTLGIPSISSKTMVIDTGTMRVTIDGANGMPGTSGDFFDLTSGDNGLIFHATAASASVAFDWRHKFL